MLPLLAEMFNKYDGSYEPRKSIKKFNFNITAVKIAGKMTKFNLYFYCCNGKLWL